MFSRNIGKVFEEAIKCISVLNVVEQGLYRNTCTGKARRTMHDCRINGNHAGEIGLLLSGHILKDKTIETEFKGEIL